MNATELDEIVKQFSTYNDYLDSMLTKDDLMFLQDKEMCRELLTLGYHSNKKIISEEEFNKKKAEIAKDINEKKVKEIKLFGAGEICNEDLMQALAKREEDNLTGRMATILFLRCINSKDEEVSAYIDFAHRLKTENWEDYFSGKKKLVPYPSDLSFYNWSKEESFYNSSPNFEVVADNDTVKLYFICKKDGKIVDVNPKTQKKDEEDNPIRHDLSVTDYLQAVLFDHITERSVP